MASCGPTPERRSLDCRGRASVCRDRPERRTRLISTSQAAQPPSRCGCRPLSGGTRPWLGLAPWVRGSDSFNSIATRASRQAPHGSGRARSVSLSPLRTDSLPLVSKIYWRQSADDAILLHSKSEWRQAQRVGNEPSSVRTVAHQFDPLRRAARLSRVGVGELGARISRLYASRLRFPPGLSEFESHVQPLSRRSAQATLTTRRHLCRPQ